MQEHDELMLRIAQCNTQGQLQEVRDTVMYNIHLSLAVKHFYFKKIDAQLTMMPLMAQMEKRGIKFTPKSLI